MSENRHGFRITSIIIALGMLFGSGFGMMIGRVHSAPEITEYPLTTPGWNSSSEMLDVQQMGDFQYEPRGEYHGKIFLVGRTSDVDENVLYSWDSINGYSTFYTFPMTGGIFRGIFCGEQVWFASVYKPSFYATVYRSVDYGVTWNQCWNQSAVTSDQSYPWYWNFAVNNDSSVIIMSDYGVKTCAKNIWRSTDLGLTWDIVYTTTRVADVHFHAVAFDNYTGRWYQSQGDEWYYDFLVSYDQGQTWHKTGLNIDPLAIIPLENEILMSGDPYSQFFSYNRSRNATECVSILHTESARRYGAFFDTKLINGVVYASSVNETTDTVATIWGSPDYGRSWVRLIMAPISGTAPQGSRALAGPDSEGYLWYSLSYAGSGSGIASARFKALSINQVWQLIGEENPRPTTSTYSTDYGLIYNGSSIQLPFARDYVDSVQMKFTGRNVTNYIANPGFETGTTSAWDLSSLSNNATGAIVTSPVFDGTYALKVYAPSEGSSGAIYGTYAWCNVSADSNMTLSFWAQLIFNYTDLLIGPRINANINFRNASDVAKGLPQANYEGGSGNAWWKMSGNQSGWARFWLRFTTSEYTAKIEPVIAIIGVGLIYLDDICIQTEGMSPYPGNNALTSYSTTNISIEIQETTYFANASLSNGQVATITLPGKWSGNPVCHIGIWGSQIANLSIVAIARARANHMLIEEFSDGFVMTMSYANSSITFFNESKWYLAPTGYLQIIPVSDSVQINVTNWSLESSATVAKWTANGTSDVIFTLSGLDSGKWYRVEVDGEPFTNIQASGGSISFTYSGPWSEHEFKVSSSFGNVSATESTLLGLVMMFVVVGILLIPVVFIVKTAKEKKKPEIKDFIEIAIIVVIGLGFVGVMWSMLG